jgi:hypothetical protein
VSGQLQRWGHLSTRKTLAEADFGLSFSVVAGPRLNADAFAVGSGDGPDELSSFYFVVVWQSRRLGGHSDVAVM